MVKKRTRRVEPLRGSNVGAERAIFILKHLARSTNGTGVRELARALGYGTNITQKTLNALRRHNFVQRNERDAKYVLGYGVVELSRAMLASIEIRAVARPHVEALAHKLEESVYLGVVDGREVVYIDRAEPAVAMRVAADIGTRHPLHCTAVGKAILAYLPDSALTSLLSGRSLKPMTARSETDPVRLRHALSEVRRAGYALDREEFAVGVGCVAAPIFDHSGTVRAAITMTTFARRLDAERLPEVVAEVKAAAVAVSSALGFVGH